jgi:hypothetical protein
VTRHRATTALLTLAQAGQAHVFFGLLYESVVRIPDRLSTDRVLAAGADEPGGAPPLLRPGNPALYFLPSAPLTLAASLGALVAGRRAPALRRWSATSAAATLAFVVETATVLHPVNERLFHTAEPPTDDERAELLRRWYRLNAIRLVFVGIAWASSQRAKSRLRGTSPA